MLIIAGGVVLGWLAIRVLGALTGASSRPTAEEHRAAADEWDRLRK